MHSTLALAIVLLFTASCSEKFKVAAPYKNVTIVLGLLSQTDTAHYIKISRGFFDESKNNIDLAKITDSIYYNALDVKMDIKNASGSLIKTITLDKVKLSDEGITKDTGIFVNNPAYAYKFKEPLSSSNTYNLHFILPNGKEVKGVTSVLGDINTSAFPFVLNMSDYNGGVNFSWTAPVNAGLCEFYYRFNYVEENILAGSFTNKSVDLPFILGQEVSTTNLGGFFNFKNKDFYALLSAAIPVKGPEIVRYVDTGDLISYAGSRELANYINQNRAQGGLTADQIKPIFSNLIGEDVYGILSSRSKKIKFGMPFTKSTVDSIKTNPITINLAFKGLSPY